MESESRIKERAAGATEKAKTEAEVKGKIIEFAWWLKKYGYSEATIKMWFGRVADLVRLGCNLLNPESVKETIAL
ncbi:MAG: hypothetical protein QMD23_01045 [Candidatus Bathyarchaeia archaeon]|nr:hypothetical protein [Candidatus Bathyarchaeia archaeon]